MLNNSFNVFGKACTLFIIIEENTKIKNLSEDMILNYQIGRFKKKFKKIFVITNVVNKYPFLGVPIFLNKFSGGSKIGKIFTGLIHTKTDYNFFLTYDMLLLEPKIIDYFLEKTNKYVMSLPMLENEVLYKFGVIRKKAMHVVSKYLKPEFFNDTKIIETLKVNYIMQRELQKIGVVFNKL